MHAAFFHLDPSACAMHVFFCFVAGCFSLCVFVFRCSFCVVIGGPGGVFGGPGDGFVVVQIPFFGQTTRNLG